MIIFFYLFWWGWTVRTNMPRSTATHGSWVPLVTHQIGGTESRSEDICIATCATSKADWSAWTHSTVFVMPLHKQVVWLCVILIVWVYTIYIDIENQRNMYWLQEERLKCCIHYISHSDILNLSLFANSIYCTHLSWTWKPPSMAIPLGNHELATTLWSLQQALCYIMLWCFLSFSASAKQQSMLGTGHFPSTFDNLSYISVQSSILWWFWSGQQASIGTLEALWYLWVSISCLHFWAFLRQCGHVDDGTMWIFHLGSQFLLCSTEFAGQAGQNWSFMLSWYWAKSHLSNMDSGLW